MIGGLAGQSVIAADEDDFLHRGQTRFLYATEEVVFG
jgi:hypothetical protein